MKIRRALLSTTQSGLLQRPPFTKFFFTIFGFSNECSSVRRREFRSSRGMTMPEMIIVATILLAVVATATPRLLQMRSSYSLQNSLRMVQVMIQTARFDALSQGVQHQVILQTTPAPRLQLQIDAARNPQAPNFVNVGTPVALSQTVQVAKGGNIVCDFSGTIATTGLDVDAISGESYLSITNGTRVFYVYVSRLGRVRVVKIS